MLGNLVLGTDAEQLARIGEELLAEREQVRRKGEREKLRVLYAFEIESCTQQFFLLILRHAFLSQ